MNWTPEDDDLLREHYAIGGSRAARTAMPHRSQEAILKRAQAINIRAFSKDSGARRNGSKWSSEMDRQLAELWGEGLSASRIAAKIGGVTRNAVIGRARRMDLPMRGNPVKPVVGSGRQRDKQRAARQLAFERILSAPVIRFDTPVYAVEDPIIPEAREADSYGKSGCLWPMWGERVTHQYCDAARVPGKPYCEHHAARAFIPLKKKDEAA